MARIFRLVALGLVLLGLAGCAAFNPKPRAYTITQAQMLELIAKRFPFNDRVAELFDLQVLAPRIKLLPESNRIATDLDISLGERVLNSVFKGKLSMDYGLRFEPTDNSIRMADVKVHGLEVAGVPDRFAPIVNGLTPMLAERLLKDFSLHQISAKDLSVVDGWGYTPGGFTVTPEGLRIALNPIKAR